MTQDLIKTTDRPSRFKKFLSKDNGSVSTFFGVCMTILLATIGAGIDFGRVNNQKTIAETVSDATVLAALAAAVESDKNKLEKPEIIGQKAGEDFWKKNAIAQKLDVAGNPQLKVWETSPDVWKATLKFDARYSTHFMSLFGNDVFPIKVYAEAVSSFDQIKEYWDVHMAVDDSASMGIGATVEIQNKMIADREIGCAFACHYSNNPNSPDTMTVAKRKGYTLRIDVVDSAIDSVMNKLDKLSDGTNVRAALHGLSDSFRQLVPLTNNLRSIQNHTIAMALSKQSKGNTNFRIAFNALTAHVGKAGDGKTAAKAKKIAIIVTDGVHDHNIDEVNVVTVMSKDYKLGPISETFCADMKANGAKVGVLYVPYITPARYGGYTNAYINDVPKKLKACASPDMFMEASQSSQIEAMLAEIVKEAFSSENDMRLTQ